MTRIKIWCEQVLKLRVLKKNWIPGVKVLKHLGVNKLKQKDIDANWTERLDCFDFYGTRGNFCDQFYSTGVDVLGFRVRNINTGLMLRNLLSANNCGKRAINVRILQNKASLWEFIIIFWSDTSVKRISQVFLSVRQFVFLFSFFFFSISLSNNVRAWLQNSIMSLCIRKKFTFVFSSHFFQCSVHKVLYLIKASQALFLFLNSRG